MDRYITRENIKHFRDRLSSEIDPKARALLQKLLIAEEDKLGGDLELLADVHQYIWDGYQRIERQCILVALMERDGHKGLDNGKALLDGLLETQLLYKDYHRRILIEISQNQL